MLDDTAETTVNYIKMSPNGVEVRKQGQVNVHMVFDGRQEKQDFLQYAIWYAADGNLSDQDWNSRRVKTAIQMKVDYGSGSERRACR